MKINIINESSNKLPKYETDGSAGMDVRSNEDAVIYNRETNVVGTGLRIAVPIGYECQVRSRSGLASRGITVTNSPGTIDSDYRGEVRVLLTNDTDRPFKINIGDRIAQLVFAPVVRCNWYSVESLEGTSRGEGGLGSTGIE
jgi:dUTP pyrophosphatase